MKTTDDAVRLSVRELVEFVLKSGDIDTRRTGAAVTDAMFEGANAHRKIQKSMGGDYRAEVALKTEFMLEGDPSARLIVEGRADGIFTRENEAGEAVVTIDEIKGVYRDIYAMEEPVPVHLAQALCYAAIHAADEDLPRIGVQITYVQLEEDKEPEKKRKSPKVKADEIRRFCFEYTKEEVQARLGEYVEMYRPWALFTVRHRTERTASVQDFPFPYPYRPGQQKITRQVYRTIRDEKNLFVQAPTGIGKTLSMLYPSVQAVGQGMGDKIFYLTAKTVTATVAEEGMKLMYDRGLRFAFVKITAKEKMCPLEKCACNPVDCPRAKGHLDRINAAVYDLITHENAVTADTISAYAEKHCVCPYEMSLDVSYYTDVIICDYNYAFAPHVFLQRYFASGAKGPYIFLIDEAHNLVDRARDMYSAVLVKEHLLQAKKLFEKEKAKRILRWIERANKAMLELKRGCEKVTVFTEEEPFPTALIYDLENLKEALEVFMDRNPSAPGIDEIAAFYFEVSDVVTTYEVMGKGYMTYAAFDDEGQFFVKLFCIDPAERLKERLDQVVSTVFFSATFLPVNYYKELLAGDTEEDAMYVDSPFDQRKKALFIASDVSSKYTRRGYEEYRKIAEYAVKMSAEKKGNYLIFLPSHKFLEEVREVLDEMLLKKEEEADRKGEVYLPPYEILSQRRVMTEEDRRDFLAAFDDPHKRDDQSSLIGLCVMGGVFSEGIDLKNEALIGVAAVGTGLPQVCTERELIRSYYEMNGENGFDFAYRFPGFNKVMQSAGRLIRTVDDEGVILLLDERFRYRENLRLFPKEWAEYEVTDIGGIEERIRTFWAERGAEYAAEAPENR